jgi:hypothetical protein
VSNSSTTCSPPGGGSCIDCTNDSFGAACVVGANDGCGCTANSDCANRETYGTYCLALSGGPRKCGCQTAADCTNYLGYSGGCCDPTTPFCDTYGTVNGSNVCVNGSWVNGAMLGAPCYNTSCGPSYCCDYSQMVNGHRGVCIQSSTCGNGVCGDYMHVCCNGTTCESDTNPPNTCQAGICQ